MKQNSLIRRKQWDVLIAVDVLSVEQLSDAAEEAGVYGEMVTANSRWPDLYQWLERNWYQFEDGSNQDVTLVCQHDLPWRIENVPWLSAWGKAIASGQKRGKDKLATALADAKRELRDNPSQKVFAYVLGGVDALPAVLEFAREHAKKYDVAISAHLNPEGGTVVPWLWVHQAMDVFPKNTPEDERYLETVSMADLDTITAPVETVTFTAPVVFEEPIVVVTHDVVEEVAEEDTSENWLDS